MIAPLESFPPRPASAGAGRLAGAPTAVVDAKGSGRGGRQDDSLLYPDADAPAEEPEGAGSETPGLAGNGQRGLKSDEAPGAVAAQKDTGGGMVPPGGGVPLLANQMARVSPDDPISAPALRKRAAQAYAESIEAVTRNPLTPGAVFDNGS